MYLFAESPYSPVSTESSKSANSSDTLKLPESPYLPDTPESQHSPDKFQLNRSIELLGIFLLTSLRLLYKSMAGFTPGSVASVLMVMLLIYI